MRAVAAVAGLTTAGPTSIHGGGPELPSTLSQPQEAATGVLFPLEDEAPSPPPLLDNILRVIGAPPLPPLPLPALRIEFDRAAFVRDRGGSDFLACFTGTQMFEAWVQTQLPRIYRYSPHAHIPLPVQQSDGTLAGSAALGYTPILAKRWFPADADTAFASRLAPSARFFAATVAAKLNRVASARSRLPYGFRGGLQPRLDAKFLEERDDYIVLHCALPPPLHSAGLHARGSDAVGVALGAARAALDIVSNASGNRNDGAGDDSRYRMRTASATRSIPRRDGSSGDFALLLTLEAGGSVPAMEDQGSNEPTANTTDEDGVRGERLSGRVGSHSANNMRTSTQAVGQHSVGRHHRHLQRLVQAAERNTKLPE